eukprot:9469791-Pyramimonas_sp.AAC.1
MVIPPYNTIRRNRGSDVGPPVSTDFARFPSKHAQKQRFRRNRGSDVSPPVSLISPSRAMFRPISPDFRRNGGADVGTPVLLNSEQTPCVAHEGRFLPSARGPQILVMCNLQGALFGVQPMGCNLWGAIYGVQPMGCNLWSAIYGVQKHQSSRTNHRAPSIQHIS